MDWLTEHFDVLLPIAVVLFFLLQRFFVRDEGAIPPGESSEADEETRRIQEEIRRKIIARQQGRTEESAQPEGGVAYQEQEPVRPVTFPRRQDSQPPVPAERQRPTVVERPSPVRRSRTEAQPASPRRDLQDELRVQKERLREARKAKAEAVRRTASRGLQRAEKSQEVPVRAGGGSVRDELLADLSTSDSMKRAFLLKEIVDRPIGLRSRPDVFSNWS